MKIEWKYLTFVLLFICFAGFSDGIAGIGFDPLDMLDDVVIETPKQQPNNVFKSQPDRGDINIRETFMPQTGLSDVEIDLTEEIPAPTEAIEPNEAPVVSETISPQMGAWPAEPSNPQRRELWKETISLEYREEKSPAQIELREAINRIRSVRLKPRTEPEPSIEPDEKTAEITEDEPEDTKTESEKPFETDSRKLSERTLEMLRNLAERPEEVDQPLKIAELLYNGRHLEEAVAFYRSALEKTPQDNKDDRAWILFQIGNCLRQDKPEEALEAYRKLVSDYPQSTWTAAGRARIEMVEFYKQEQGEEWMARHEQ